MMCFYEIGAPLTDDVFPRILTDVQGTGPVRTKIWTTEEGANSARLLCRTTAE